MRSIPSGKPFVPGIQNYRSYSHYLGSPHCLCLGVNQQQFAQSVALMFSINAQLAEKYCRYITLDLRPVTGYCLLRDMDRRDGKESEYPRRFGRISENIRPAQIEILILHRLLLQENIDVRIGAGEPFSVMIP